MKVTVTFDLEPEGDSDEQLEEYVWDKLESPIIGLGGTNLSIETGDVLGFEVGR